jgi:hypothetical protein
MERNGSQNKDLKNFSAATRHYGYIWNSLVITILGDFLLSSNLTCFSKNFPCLWPSFDTSYMDHILNIQDCLFHYIYNL